MALEQTLTIIKPDAVARNVIGKITAQIEEIGLVVIAVRMLHLSAVQAEELYEEHKGKPFFESLLEFMISGPVIVMVLEGNNAIQSLRKLMGATIPSNAEPGTIRHTYNALQVDSGKVHENVIHGSDSAESAAREINFFFNRSEICPRTR